MTAAARANRSGIFFVSAIANSSSIRPCGKTITFPSSRPGLADRRLVGGSVVDHDRLAGSAEALTEAGISIRDVPYIQIAWGEQIEKACLDDRHGAPSDHRDHRSG